jgi:hypothetical protein
VADPCVQTATQALVLEVHGTWRSLVAHRVWDAGVAGSNPAVPINLVSGIAGHVSESLRQGPGAGAWPTVSPQMRERVRTRYALLAGCVLVLALIAGGLIIVADGQVPGPTSATSSELDALATGQARQDIDPHVVGVRCPGGTFHIGSEVSCTARLRFAHARLESQALHVKLRHDDGGGLYVEVSR